MFQFIGLLTVAGVTGLRPAGLPPFGHLRIKSFANPRSFSQLNTSFFASKSLGIPLYALAYFFVSHNPARDRLCNPLLILKSVKELFPQQAGHR